MLDVAVVVGHCRDTPGDYGLLEQNERSVSEYDFNLRLAKELCFGLVDVDFTRNLFVRTASSGPIPSDRYLIHEIREFNPQLIVELHFNTLSKRHFKPEKWQWRACSAVHAPNDDISARLGEHIVEPIADLLNLDAKVHQQARSWSQVTKNKAGNWCPDGPELAILTRVDCPAILLEHHVGNDVDIHARALAALKNGTLARALADGITGALNTLR